MLKGFCLFIYIYTPPLTRKLEKWRVTIRSGLLTSISSSQRNQWPPIAQMNGFWIHSLQLCHLCHSQLH